MFGRPRHIVRHRLFNTLDNNKFYCKKLLQKLASKLTQSCVAQQQELTTQSPQVMR
jgi:hypothetical protein